MKSIKLFLFVLIMLTAFCSCRKSDSTNKESKIFYGVDHTNEFTTEELTFIINGQKISSDFFEIQIPDGFSASQDGNSLIIENENDNIDINIEEQVFGESNINQYLAETIDKYRQMGAEVSQPEIVTINNIEMQRFKLVFIQMNALEYVVDLGDKAILISIVSNDDIPVDVVDMLIEDLKIIIN